MLQVFFNLLFSTTKFVFRVLAILTGLVLSSLGNAALAFLNAEAGNSSTDEDHYQNSIAKGFVVDELGAQTAYQNGIMDAAEAVYFNED